MTAIVGKALQRRNTQFWSAASESNHDAQEGGGNGRGIRARAFVLSVEQIFKLVLEIRGSAALFGGVECIHGGPVILPEFCHGKYLLFYFFLFALQVVFNMTDGGVRHVMVNKKPLLN